MEVSVPVWLKQRSLTGNVKKTQIVLSDNLVLLDGEQLQLADLKVDIDNDEAVISVHTNKIYCSLEAVDQIRYRKTDARATSLLAKAILSLKNGGSSRESSLQLLHAYIASRNSEIFLRILWIVFVGFLFPWLMSGCALVASLLVVVAMALLGNFLIASAFRAKDAKL